jgi:hypothetical protein
VPESIWDPPVSYFFMKSSKPIKRNENLLWLSRDHHHGLMLGWKVKQGLQNGTDLREIAAYVHFSWVHAIMPHFRDEEQYLFVALPEKDGKRCLAEAQHTYLGQLAEIINDGSRILCEHIFEEFSEMMDKHIRFEEKILFPYLEQKLNSEQLNKIGWQLEQTHAVKFVDNWHHEFWKKKTEG